MNQPVIVSTARTPIARKNGKLKMMDPAQFGAICIREALTRGKLDHTDVDDVIIGNCLSGGGNIARLSLLEAGLNVSVPGMTIDRQCGSGINAVSLAAQAISLKDQIIVAGGTESMTNEPFLMQLPKTKGLNATPTFETRPLSPDWIGNPSMGITAENLGEKYDISREEQDDFALSSQFKMKEAQRKGYFKEQMTLIHVVENNQQILFDTDEHPRPSTTIEGLAKLAPVFKENGTVTAGNASGLNDGAGALVMMSERNAIERNLKPLVKVVGWEVAGVDPHYMGIGPVPATQKLLKHTNLTLDDIDLIEINEAFAVQVLACLRELKVDPHKVNVTGGAIAHGHPIGATGAILVIKLAHELRRRNLKRGIVTACIGGGQGIALLLENDH